MPAQLVHIARRDDLVQKLEDGRRRRLSLIQAPAGFGKTTLLMQWQDLLEAKEVAVTWVTFADEAWTPGGFLEVLTAALNASGLRIERSDPLFQQRAVEQWRFTSEAILRALEQSALPRVIVLDEYEHCDNENISKIVIHLLNHLPPFVHLAITSRHRPMLPIARHYAAGQVTLLGPNDLRLSRAEACILLESMLAPDVIERVYEITEGWAVVLQLVRIWLEAGGDSETVVDLLTDQKEEVTMFLVEQVISALTPDERDFLVETSFLDRFTPALCDFVRQAEGSERFLEGMSRLYPLVRAMSGDPPMVRVHPLLRAQARHLLALKSRKVLADLQRRAALWFAQSGETYLAVFYAMEVGDRELAAEIFLRAGAILVADSEGLPPLERILSLLPSEISRHYPRIRLAQAALLSATGETKEAWEIFNQVQEETEEFTADGDARLNGDAMICHLFLLVFSDKTASSAFLKDLQDSILINRYSDIRIRSLVPAFLALSLLQRGELVTARDAILAAQSLINESERPYQSSFAIIYGAVHDQIQGKLWSAKTKLDQSMGFLEIKENAQRFGTAESRLRTSGNLSLLTALSIEAEVLLDLGRLNEANAALHRAETEFAGVMAWFDVYAPQLRVGCELSYLAGGFDAVVAVIQRFVHGDMPFQSDRLGNLITAHKAKAAARSGRRANMDIEALADLWNSFCAAPASVTWRELDGIGFAYSRMLVALGQARRALKVVDDLELMAAEHDWRKTLVECHLLRAMAWAALDERDLAVVSMKESLILAEPLDIRSPFLLEGDASAHIMSLVIDEAERDDPIRDFAIHLLQGRKELSTPLTLPFLSPREHLVLSELCRGHANKVIARNLGMSENTVKTHLKNIFRKADIESRAQAIEFARRHFIGGAP